MDAICSRFTEFYSLPVLHSKLLAFNFKMAAGIQNFFILSISLVYQRPEDSKFNLKNSYSDLSLCLSVPLRERSFSPS